MPRPSPHQLLAGLGAALLLARSAPARACSVCGCGDPLLLSSDPAAIAGPLRLQLDAEYLRVDAGTDGAPGSTDELVQWSTRLNLAWRPLEALSLTATLPWVHKTIRTVGGGAAVTSSELAGPGDVEVAARWSAWRAVEVGARRVQEVAFSAGSALPTGRKDARDGGALIDPHGQLGTGGWGPFAGVHYRLEQGDFTAFASLSYRVRTEARYFDGTRYRFGDAALWSLHGQWQASRRWVLDLGLDGRRAAADRATDEAGLVDPRVASTGGTVLAAAPAVYLGVGGELWLFARGQLPVLQALRGQQRVWPSASLGLQLTVR